MDKNRFLELLQKRRLGTATPEELELIRGYYDLFEDEPGLAELSPEEVEQIKENVRERTWASIRAQEPPAKTRISSLFFRPLRMAAAVAALTATGLTVFLLVNRKARHEQTGGIAQQHRQDKIIIHPGGNKAILTLANGQEMVLNNTVQGTLIHQGAADIQNQRKGELIYKVSGHAPAAVNGTTAYNTITTPMGGQFKLSLSDGTKVWLNAGSSLRYPVAFNGDHRQVWLTGEAYFEVAKQQGKSFQVEAGTTEVQVLGTHFNVNAYSDETLLRTTLTEGAVKVSGAGGSKILKPGEQASINQQNGEMKVAVTDVDMALAWTRDIFLFDNTNIETIMRDVSRWYDVKVVYQTKNLGNKNFSGVMSRYEEVDALLERLELTGFIHFKVEGKTITVMD